MYKTRKTLSLVMAAVLLVSIFALNSPAKAATRNVTKPKINPITLPQAQYSAGDLISIAVNSPNYSGKVEYRIRIWDETAKAYTELWPKSQGYYNKASQPKGNIPFKISKTFVKPGVYSITVMVRRVGSKASYESYYTTASILVNEKAGAEPEKATFESIIPVNDVTVQQGETPELPNTVKIKMSDSTEKEASVTWAAVDTTKIGQYSINGDVEGVSEKAVVNVIVKPEVLKIVQVYAVNSMVVNLDLSEAFKYMPEKDRFSLKDSNGRVFEPISINAYNNNKSLQIIYQYIYEGNKCTLAIDGKNFEFIVPYTPKRTKSTPKLSVSVLDCEVSVGSKIMPVVDVNVSDAVLAFASGNEEIASVNSTTGEVTGIAEGTATITVTAEKSGYINGSASFTVTVTKVPEDTQSRLTGLKVFKGKGYGNSLIPLDKSFSPEVTEYSVAVSAGAIHITPTASGGIITVNGEQVKSNKGSVGMSLEGVTQGTSTVATIVISQEGKTPTTYTIVINRKSEESGSEGGCSGEGGKGGEGEEGGSGGGNGGEGEEGGSGGSGGEVGYPTEPYQGQTSLTQLKLVSGDGSEIPLDQEFTPGTFEYTATVNGNSFSVLPEEDKGTILVNGNEISYEEGWGPVEISMGEASSMTVAIEVRQGKAEKNDLKVPSVYIIRITKGGEDNSGGSGGSGGGGTIPTEPKKAETRLTQLKLVSGDMTEISLSPVFNPETFEYTATVIGNSFSVMPEENKGTILVNGTEISYEEGWGPVEISMGEASSMTVAIEVRQGKAEKNDLKDPSVYIIRITKSGEGSPGGSGGSGTIPTESKKAETRLTQLRLISGDGAEISLSPVFNPETFNYTATVTGSSITVRPEAAKGTILVNGNVISYEEGWGPVEISMEGVSSKIVAIEVRQGKIEKNDLKDPSVYIITVTKEAEGKEGVKTEEGLTGDGTGVPGSNTGSDGSKDPEIILDTVNQDPAPVNDGTTSGTEEPVQDNSITQVTDPEGTSQSTDIIQESQQTVPAVDTTITASDASDSDENGTTLQQEAAQSPSPNTDTIQASAPSVPSDENAVSGIDDSDGGSTTVEQEETQSSALN